MPEQRLQRNHVAAALAEETQQVSTVAVMLSRRFDGQRPWDTTAIAVLDGLDLTPDEASAYRDFVEQSQVAPADLRSVAG